MNPDYEVTDPHPRPVIDLVTAIVGTEDVLEIRKNGALVAVLIDSAYYEALKGEAEGQAY